MAASVAGFKVLFPEFSTRDSGQLSATLANIERRVSSEFGEQRDEMIYLELADTLTASLKGRPGRAQQEGQSESVYARKLRQLRETHALTRRTA